MGGRLGEATKEGRVEKKKREPTMGTEVNHYSREYIELLIMVDAKLQVHSNYCHTPD